MVYGEHDRRARSQPQNFCAPTSKQRGDALGTHNVSQPSKQAWWRRGRGSGFRPRVAKRERLLPCFEYVKRIVDGACGEACGKAGCQIAAHFRAQSRTCCGLQASERSKVGSRVCAMLADRGSNANVKGREPASPQAGCNAARSRRRRRVHSCCPHRGALHLHLHLDHFEWSDHERLTRSGGRSGSNRGPRARSEPCRELALRCKLETSPWHNDRKAWAEAAP